MQPNILLKYYNIFRNKCQQCIFLSSGKGEYSNNMASFAEANLVKKLSDLNNTQQSIQTLSLWLIHHRKHASSIVKIWHRELAKGKWTENCFGSENGADAFNCFNVWSTQQATRRRPLSFWVAAEEAYNRVSTLW